MSDPQHDLKLWVREQLALMGHGAKLALAKALGRTRSDFVTRMINTKNPDKEARKISTYELEVIARFFNSDPPGFKVLSVSGQARRLIFDKKMERLTPDDADDLYEAFEKIVDNALGKSSPK